MPGKGFDGLITLKKGVQALFASGVVSYAIAALSGLPQDYAIYGSISVAMVLGLLRGLDNMRKHWNDT
jgi:hypothetical protein